MTDRQTDGRTDGRTELAWHICAIAYMLSHVKIKLDMEAILICGGNIDLQWGQYCLVKEIARFSERHDMISTNHMHTFRDEV